jgi:hypothetical protein
LPVQNIELYYISLHIVLCYGFEVSFAINDGNHSETAKYLGAYASEKNYGNYALKINAFARIALQYVQFECNDLLTCSCIGAFVMQ